MGSDPATRHAGISPDVLRTQLSLVRRSGKIECLHQLSFQVFGFGPLVWRCGAGFDAFQPGIHAKHKRLLFAYLEGLKMSVVTRLRLCPQDFDKVHVD